MKKNYTILFLLFTLLNLAQPANYYITATGSGYTLKTQLYNIINNNTNSSGTANYGDLWNLYTTTAFRDNYYENDGSLLDVYSEIPNTPPDTALNDSYEYTSTGQQCGNYSGEGDCYNREHVIPKSVFNDNYPMYSDAHFVLPTDGWVNNKRDTYAFGKVSSPTYTSSNGSKLGSNLNSGYSAGYSGVVFEPIDEFKGDIARALLYFATRYQDQTASWTYTMFNGTSNQVFTNTFLNILISWHNLDPVSPYEIAKNDAVYNFQGNRNPYIDHPEYVCQIWPTQCATLNTNSFASNSISVYPNPSNTGNFTITSVEDLTRIAIYNINGQLIQEENNPSKISDNYEITGLASGFYFLELSNNSAKQIKKILVN